MGRFTVGQVGRVKGLAALLLITVMMAAALTGCWSRKEIETLAIVDMIGIDRVIVNGREKYRLAVLIERPEQLQGGGRSAGGMQGTGGGGQQPSWLVTSLGDTLTEAEKNLFTRSPRYLFLAHTNIILIGESLARNPGVQEVTDYLLRHKDIRLRSIVIIPKGDVLETMLAEPELEKLLAERLFGMVTFTQSRVSKGYQQDLLEWANCLIQSGRDLLAPRLTLFTPTEGQAGAGGGDQGKADEKAVRLNGAAVFRKDKLVGWLEDMETLGYLLLTGRAVGTVIPIRLSGSQEPNSSFNMTRMEAHPRVELVDGRFVFPIHIRVEGDQQLIGQPDFDPDPSTLEQLNLQVARQLKEIMASTLYKAQQEYGADIFGFGELVHINYPQVWREIKDQWREIFPEVEVRLEVDAFIRRTGIIGPSIPIQ